jgi:hypothetical protein
MIDDILTRLREDIASCFCYNSLDDYECDICPLNQKAADEIERLRKQNAILFDALQALTKGKSVYFTDSSGKTLVTDAQNSWMDVPNEK